MGNVNEATSETSSTTINKAIRAFENKKEDEGKIPTAGRPKKRNRHSEPIFTTPAKLSQSSIPIANISVSRPPSRLHIRDADSEMWITMNSSKLEAPALNTDISTASSNSSLPISESVIPETFDVSSEMSFVNRSEVSDFFVTPSLTDLGVVDQVPFAEIPSLTTAMAQIELEDFTPEASSNGPSLILPTYSHLSSALDTQRMAIGSQPSQPIGASATLPIPDIVVEDRSMSSCRDENAYMAISSSTSGMSDINVDVTSTTSIFTAPALPSSPNIIKSNADAGNTNAYAARDVVMNDVSRNPASSAPVLLDTPKKIAKLPKDIPLVATYADAMNLAVQFPEIASQVLSRPLLSPPSKGLDEANFEHGTDVFKIPHTATSPNWAAAPLEPKEAPDTGFSTSRLRRRQSGRSGGPSQAELPQGPGRRNGGNRSSISRPQPTMPAGSTYADQVEQQRRAQSNADRQERSGRGFIDIPPHLDPAARPFIPRLSYDRREFKHPVETSQSQPGHQHELPQPMLRETQSASTTYKGPETIEWMPATHDPRIPKATISQAKESPEQVSQNHIHTHPVTVPVLQPKEPTQAACETAPHQELNDYEWTPTHDPWIPKPVVAKPSGVDRKPVVQAMSHETQSAKGPVHIQSNQPPQAMALETQSSSAPNSGRGKPERAVTFGSAVVIPIMAEASQPSVKLTQVSNADTATVHVQDTSNNGFHFVHDPWVNPPSQDPPQAVASVGREDREKPPPLRSRSRSPASGPPGKRARRSRSGNRESSPKPTKPKIRDRQKARKQQVADISAAARRHLEGSIERKAVSNASPRRHSVDSEVATNHMNRDDGTKLKQSQHQGGGPQAELLGPVATPVSEKISKPVEPEDSSVIARAPGSGDSPFRDIHMRAINASPVPHRSPSAAKGASVDPCNLSTNSIQRSPHTGSPLAARDNEANFQAVEALRNASFEIGLTSANDWLPPLPTQSIPESALSSVVEPTIPTMPTIPYATPFSTLFKTKTKPRSASLQVPKSPISWRRAEPLTVPTPFGLDPNDNATPSWLTPPGFFTPDPTSGKYIAKGRLSAEGLEKYPGLPPVRSRKSLPSQSSMDVGPPSSSKGGGDAPFRFGSVESDPQKAIHDLIRTIPSTSRSISMKIQRPRA